MKSILWSILLFSLLPLFTQAQTATVSSVSPTSPRGGDVLTVSIAGTNTNFQQGSTSALGLVNGYTVSPSAVNANSDTDLDLTFQLPCAACGDYLDIYLYNPIDSTMDLMDVVMIDCNSMTLTPPSGQAGQTLNVSIAGSGLNFQQGSNVVSFGQGSNTAIQTNSSTVANNNNAQVNITLPNYCGYWPVTATAANGCPVSSGFNVTVGTLVSASPQTVQAGQTLNVSIAGSGTNFTQGSGTFYFQQGSQTIYPNSVNPISTTQADVNVSFPSNMNTCSDYWDVCYTDGTCTECLYDAIYSEQNVPEITSITPNTATAGSNTLSITISGNNIPFSQGSTLILFINNATGQTETATPVSTTANSVTCELITPPVGTYDLLFGNTYMCGSQLNESSALIITAQSPPPACAGLNMNLTVQQDSANNYQLWIQPTISGASTSNSFTYEWNFGDGSAPVTGNTPTHTYAAFGTYTICVEATDSSGCVLNDCTTITIDSSGNFSRSFTIAVLEPIIDIQSGVQPIEVDAALIKMYPNPASAITTLEIDAPASEEASIRVIDLNGRILMNQQVVIQTGTQTVDLEIQNLNRGIYFVQYQGETATQNFKLIKR